MSRSGAEELLLGANMTNGLFLVRQSERSASDYALSFCYNRKVYHNRIMKGGDGAFSVLGGKLGCAPSQASICPAVSCFPAMLPADQSSKRPVVPPGSPTCHVGAGRTFARCMTHPCMTRFYISACRQVQEHQGPVVEHHRGDGQRLHVAA